MNFNVNNKNSVQPNKQNGLNIIHETYSIAPYNLFLSSHPSEKMYSYQCNNSKRKALPVVILCYSDGCFRSPFGTGASETNIERTNITRMVMMTKYIMSAPSTS